MRPPLLMLEDLNNLLGPWPEKIVILDVHLVFLVAYASLLVWRWFSPNTRAASGRSSVTSGLLWKVAFACCIFLLSVNIALLLLTYFNGVAEVVREVLAARVVLVVSWIVLSWELHTVKRQGKEIFPVILRAWWITLFVLAVLSLSLDFGRFTVDSSIPWTCLADIASFPACVFLLVAAVRGKSGVKLEAELDGLREPFLNGNSQSRPASVQQRDSLYKKAGFLSRVTFSWLNPLLAVGARKPLQLEDIPLLAEEDRAGELFRRLKSSWDRLSATRPDAVPSISLALLQTFWPEVAFTGLLSAVTVPVVFVGPVLIVYFVEYMAGEQHFPYEGFVLPSCVFLAKVIENLATRHMQWGLAKLGLDIKTALSAQVYQKGLRLSSASKQLHKTGEIVNYMSVDVQRICDFMAYIHDLWIIPLQICFALAVLYRVVGLATIATVGTTLILVVVNAPLGNFQKNYQERVMAAKDERVKATSESLRNMRVLKLQAWEVRHMQRLEQLRNVEYGWLRKSLQVEALLSFVYYSAPTFIAAATFGTCVLLEIPLTAGKVFSALATFRTLQEPLTMVPDLIMVMGMTRVSLDRLQGLFKEKDLKVDAVECIPQRATSMAVEVEGGEFSWDEVADKPTLSGLNLHVQKGQRVAVCGTVGSGKSSLLSCILGETTKSAGTVKVSGRTAYVAQSAWIQSCSIQDNILFGSEMDRAKYEKVLQACALKKDLELFPFGDQTEIGERGINLSGGQKQRIQIARALYQDADIYLLDDPFSAVDAHTGSTLFKECIIGAMAGKTVIFVTHQMEFLPAADLIVVMRDGEVSQSGKYEELLQLGTDFSILVQAHKNAIDSMEGSESSVLNFSEVVQCASIPIHADGAIHDESSLTRQNGSLVSPVAPSQPASEPMKKAQLVQEEERESGRITADVYWAYLTAYCNGAMIPLIFLAQILFQLLSIVSNWWMAWAAPAVEGEDMRISSKQLILVFIALSLASAIFVGMRAILVAITGIGTAQQFFLRMLHSIFRAPMSFFDSTPTGRILSRVSSDQSCLDDDFHFKISGVLSQTLQLVGTTAVLAYVTSEVLFVFVPVAFVGIWMQQYSIASARELSRLTGIFKAPIIHHYAESVAGAATIRGSGQQQRFIETNLEVIDRQARSSLHLFATTLWLILRSELLSNVIFAFSLILLLRLPSGVVDPNMAGLAVTYGLTLNSTYHIWLWQLSAMEKKVISVERIKQYTSLPSEGPLVIDSSRPPKQWPTSGRVELKELKVRYNATSPLVLHGISCIFSGGQKVGIVGRTGSGKSTLIQALFRMVEPASGSIIIDGIDISAIGLHDLRPRLSIIPQDPTLFEGDIRGNLDPLGEHSDAAVWEVIRKCHLEDAVRSKEEKLNAPVTENGENWSMGQRQLLSLGRALLKSSRILVLDEATASVDTATDRLIQQTLREEFFDRTVITVAHRIPTVIDSDTVLVLHDGRMAEYDSPSKLLGNRSSMFAKLVQEYWERSENTSNPTHALE